MVKDRHLKYAAGGLVLFALTQRDGENGGSDPDDGNGDNDNGGSDPGDDNGGGSDPDTNQPPEGVYVSGSRDGDVMNVWEDSGSDPDGTIVQWEWRLERTDTGGEPSVVDTASGQNATLELAGTGDYRIVCIATDNDGASAQDVWNFPYHTDDSDDDNGGSDPGDGNGGGNDAPTLSDVNVVSVDPSTYNAGGQYSGDITLRADVENTADLGTTAGVVYRIDGIDALSDSVYVDGGSTVESSVSVGVDYLRNSFGTSGTVTAEVVQLG